MNYILRKQIGPSFKGKFLYFNGDTDTAADFTKYTCKTVIGATRLTEDETKAFSAKINQGAFRKIKISEEEQLELKI